MCTSVRYQGQKLPVTDSTSRVRWLYQTLHVMSPSGIMCIECVLSSINGSVYLLSLCCGLLFRLSECPISDKYQRKHEPWNDTHENTKNQRIDGESHIYVIDLLLN